MFSARPSGASFSSVLAGREELRTRARDLLLALAADLERLDLRTRLVERVSRPVTLRVWEPSRQSGSAEVVASPRIDDGFVFVLMNGGPVRMPAAVAPADVPAVAARKFAESWPARGQGMTGTTRPEPPGS
jgi:hypothetical protein